MYGSSTMTKKDRKNISPLKRKPLSVRPLWGHEERNWPYRRRRPRDLSPSPSTGYGSDPALPCHEVAGVRRLVPGFSASTAPRSLRASMSCFTSPPKSTPEAHCWSATWSTTPVPAGTIAVSICQRGDDRGGERRWRWVRGGLGISHIPSSPPFFSASVSDLSSN